MFCFGYNDLALTLQAAVRQVNVDYIDRLFQIVSFIKLSFLKKHSLFLHLKINLKKHTLDREKQSYLFCQGGIFTVQPTQQVKRLEYHSRSFQTTIFVYIIKLGSSCKEHGPWK